MNLDSRHWSVFLQHWLREINQVLKMERLWCIEETNFWELWRVRGYVRHLPFSAALQLAVLLFLFLLVWSMGMRRNGTYSIIWPESSVSFILLWEKAETSLYSLTTFPHQEDCQCVEGRRNHRAILPPLAQVRLEEHELHWQAWKVGKQKSWDGHQERNRLRREWEIRGKAELSCVCLGRHWWCRQLTSLLANRKLPVDGLDLFMALPQPSTCPTQPCLPGMGEQKSESEKNHGLQ